MDNEIQYNTDELERCDIILKIENDGDKDVIKLDKFNGYTNHRDFREYMERTFDYIIDNELILYSQYEITKKLSKFRTPHNNKDYLFNRQLNVINKSEIINYGFKDKEIDIIAKHWARPFIQIQQEFFTDLITIQDKMPPFDKINTSFNSYELTLLIKLLFEQDVFDPKKEPLLKAFAKYFTTIGTVSKQELSPGTLIKNWSHIDKVFKNNTGEKYEKSVTEAVLKLHKKLTNMKDTLYQVKKIKKI